MVVLITGGAGYIGSHTCLELIRNGYDIVVIDNLCNSCHETIVQVEKYTGQEIPFYEGDILDTSLLDRIFNEHHIDACIHFAGYKAVGESVGCPWNYYHNNLSGTLSLLDIMWQHNCKNLIFSSTAAVYGVSNQIPITEECPTGDCTNPYAKTKLMIEDILKDIKTSDDVWNIVILRYFNPIGAHPSGIIGENPVGIPTNLMPYITKVANGELKELNIFGNDYDTPDGTGVRDYIHVVDLAKGHLKALEKIKENAGLKTYNLGTGRGYSVLEVIKTFEAETSQSVPYVIKERRQGDVARCYCDPTKAREEMGWEAQYDIFDMCRDAWRWEQNSFNNKE